MGRQQKYPVQLTDEESEQLQTLTRTGKQSARVIKRAQILLWSDFEHARTLGARKTAGRPAALGQ